MSELSKLLNQYGLTTATPALYAGATMPSAPVAPTDTTDTAAASKYAEQQAQYNTDMANYNANGASDQAAYKQYLDNYNNRIQYTPQYTDAQYQIRPKATVAQGSTMSPALQQNAPLTVEDLYSKYLNRPAEQAGVDYWKQQFGSDISPTEVKQFLAAGTPELQSRGMNTYGQQYANATGNYWTDTLKDPTYAPPIANTPYVAPIANTSLGSDQASINAAQMAKGGSVHELYKKYADGGGVTTDPSLNPTEGPVGWDIANPETLGTVATQAPPAAPVQDQAPVQAQTQTPASDSNPIQEAMARYRASTKGFTDTMANAMNNPEMAQANKSEGFYRLAAALGAPTRSGTLGENLALASGEMAEQEKAKQEMAMNRVKMQLAAQKYAQDAAKEDVVAQIADLKSLRAMQEKQAENEQKDKNETFRNETERIKAAAYAKGMESYSKTLGKPPVGQRWSADGTHLETIPGGPVEQKEQATLASHVGFSEGLQKLQEINNRLKEIGAIRSNNDKGMVDNLVKLGKSSDIGQATFGGSDPEAQKLRDEYKGVQKSLVGLFIGVSGGNSQIMRTNLEQMNFLRSLGDPSFNFETNQKLLENQEKRYGTSSAKAQVLAQQLGVKLPAVGSAPATPAAPKTGLSPEAQKAFELYAPKDN